jgi:hypothetical protein
LIRSIQHPHRIDGSALAVAGNLRFAEGIADATTIMLYVGTSLFVYNHQQSKPIMPKGEQPARFLGK